MTHDDLHRLERKSARAVPAAGRPTSKEKQSMPARPTLHPVPDPGEIVEMVDNGVRLAPVELMPMPAPDRPTAIADYLARRPEKEPVPLEAETVERVAAAMGDARDSLMGAMKRLDLDREQLGAAELHVRVGEIVNQIDDLAAFLAERRGS